MAGSSAGEAAACTMAVRRARRAKVRAARRVDGIVAWANIKALKMPGEGIDTIEDGARVSDGGQRVSWRVVGEKEKRRGG